MAQGRCPLNISQAIMATMKIAASHFIATSSPFNRRQNRTTNRSMRSTATATANSVTPVAPLSGRPDRYFANALELVRLYRFFPGCSYRSARRIRYGPALDQDQRPQAVAVSTRLCRRRRLLPLGDFVVGRVMPAGGGSRRGFSWWLTGPHTPQAPVVRGGSY
jgi:hypothetical protein